MPGNSRNRQSKQNCAGAENLSVLTQVLFGSLQRWTTMPAERKTKSYRCYRRCK